MPPPQEKKLMASHVQRQERAREQRREKDKILTDVGVGFTGETTRPQPFKLSFEQRPTSRGRMQVRRREGELLVSGPAASAPAPAPAPRSPSSDLHQTADAAASGREPPALESQVLSPEPPAAPPLSPAALRSQLEIERQNWHV